MTNKPILVALLTSNDAADNTRFFGSVEPALCKIPPWSFNRWTI
jgi:hypothetical protein